MRKHLAIMLLALGVFAVGCTHSSRKGCPCGVSKAKCECEAKKADTCEECAKSEKKK